MQVDDVPTGPPGAETVTTVHARPRRSTDRSTAARQPADADTASTGAGTAPTANAAQRRRGDGGDQQQAMAGVVLDPHTEALLDAVVEAAPPLPVEARMRLVYLLGRQRDQATGRPPTTGRRERLGAAAQLPDKAGSAL